MDVLNGSRWDRNTGFEVVILGALAALLVLTLLTFVVVPLVVRLVF